MTTATATRRKRRGGITPSVWREVVVDRNCHYCGYVATEADHVVPVSRGGSDDPENLVPACTECNAQKSDLLPDEWAAARRAAGKPWPIPSYTTRLKFLCEWYRPRLIVANGRYKFTDAEFLHLRSLLMEARDCAELLRPTAG